MRLSRGLAVAASVAVVLAILFAVSLRDGGPTTARRALESSSLRQRPALAPRPRADALGGPTTEHTDAPLPASLRETEVDGWLGVDDDGHLVVTPGARRFFDYFLSATGEETEAEIRTRIVAEIERRLPPAGASEAIALLDRYLTYREGVRAAWTDHAGNDLNQRLGELHQIRVEAFGESTAAILFGDEEQAQRVDLQRRALMSDSTLSPEQRERRLHDIEQQLPAAVRAARADTFAPLHLRQDEQALREAGGSADDIRMLREQRFGAEAADRLAALDREQAAWQQRVDDYRHARDSIERDPTLNDAARAQALESMISQRFTTQERLRIDATLDRGP